MGEAVSRRGVTSTRGSDFSHELLAEGTSVCTINLYWDCQWDAVGRKKFNSENQQIYLVWLLALHEA